MDKQVGGILYILIAYCFYLLKRNCGDFLGCPMAKNLPCNSGDIGPIPGWRIKISHAVGQQSPHGQLPSPRATAKELVPCSEESACHK